MNVWAENTKILTNSRLLRMEEYLGFFFSLKSGEEKGHQAETAQLLYAPHTS